MRKEQQMGYKKLIQFDKTAGQHVHGDVQTGEHSATELQRREDQRGEALKAAIEGQSSKQGVSGDTLDHPAWNDAKQRLAAQYDRENAETNAKSDDTPELTARKEKRT